MGNNSLERDVGIFSQDNKTRQILEKIKEWHFNQLPLSSGLAAMGVSALFLLPGSDLNSTPGLIDLAGRAMISTSVLGYGIHYFGKSEKNKRDIDINIDWSRFKSADLEQKITGSAPVRYIKNLFSYIKDSKQTMKDFPEQTRDMFKKTGIIASQAVFTKLLYDTAINHPEGWRAFIERFYTFDGVGDAVSWYAKIANVALFGACLGWMGKDFFNSIYSIKRDGSYNLINGLIGKYLKWNDKSRSEWYEKHSKKESVMHYYSAAKNMMREKNFLSALRYLRKIPAVYMNKFGNDSGQRNSLEDEIRSAISESENESKKKRQHGLPLIKIATLYSFVGDRQHADEYWEQAYKETNQMPEILVLQGINNHSNFGYKSALPVFRDALEHKKIRIIKDQTQFGGRRVFGIKGSEFFNETFAFVSGNESNLKSEIQRTKDLKQKADVYRKTNYLTVSPVAVLKSGEKHFLAMLYHDAEPLPIAAQKDSSSLEIAVDYLAFIHAVMTKEKNRKHDTHKLYLKNKMLGYLQENNKLTVEQKKTIWENYSALLKYGNNDFLVDDTDGHTGQWGVRKNGQTYIVRYDMEPHGWGYTSQEEELGKLLWRAETVEKTPNGIERAKELSNIYLEGYNSHVQGNTQRHEEKPGVFTPSSMERGILRNLTFFLDRHKDHAVQDAIKTALQNSIFLGDVLIDHFSNFYTGRELKSVYSLQQVCKQIQTI